MLYNVQEHVVPATHIREYHGSTLNSQEEVLQLAVKQYTPKEQPNPLPSDAVTFIACHGTGVAKEIYEPLWDDLLEQSRARGFTIRGIWIADMVNHGQSALLNEGKLGTDVSWWDHPRDLLQIINHFRSDMPRPIVGIGHSTGGNQIVSLALMHPRLFMTVLLLEPALQITPPTIPGRPGVGNFVLYRPETYPSRKAATASITKSRAYSTWDPRALSLLAKHAFRDVHPLPAGADPADPPVTSATSKYQEAATYFRENFAARDSSGRISIDRRTHADMDPMAAFRPTYRPEPGTMWKRLPELRPSALFILAGKTMMNLDEMRAGIKTTGCGIGGSGGIPEGRVKEETFMEEGHFFPFTAPGATAESCAKWVKAELQRHHEVEEWFRKREQRERFGKTPLSDQWYEVVKHPSTFPKIVPAKPPAKAKL